MMQGAGKLFFVAMILHNLHFSLWKSVKKIHLWNKSQMENIVAFEFLNTDFCFSGKLSLDSEQLNNNNHKWSSTCTNLLQNSINCINSSLNDDKLSSNNNNKPSNNQTMSLNHQRELSLTNHHPQHNMHHHLSSLSSPFSSLPYLLDPLGNLQKSAASNNLFWTRWNC